MNKLMIAIAATIALPAAALAQATPGAVSPAAHGAKATDCQDMHAAMSGAHSGHQATGSSAQADHSKMSHGKMDHSAGARAGHAAAADGQSCHHAAKLTAGAKAATGHQQHQH